MSWKDLIMHVRRSSITVHPIVSAVTAVLIVLLTVSETYSGNGSKEDPFRNILISDTLINSNVGIHIVNCSTSEDIYRYNENKLFIPASVLKIITAYAALKVLTPQYVFSTNYLAKDTVADSSAVSMLYIKGNGDPTLSTDDLNNQASSIAAKIKEIRDGIVVDNTFFDTIRLGSGWMWDDPNTPVAPFFINNNLIDLIVSPGAVRGQTATASSLPASSFIDVSVENVTDDNRIRILHEKLENREKYVIAGPFSSVTAVRRFRTVVHQPELFAGTVFKELLAKNGTEVGGPVRIGRVPSDAQQFASFNSPPLGDIVKTFLKESNNLTGECLLKTLGTVDSGSPGEAYKGVREVQKVLKEIGIEEKKYRMVDGSGLSTYNLLTPEQLVTVLKAAYRDFTIYPEFSSALAVAGADGTLRSRMDDSLLVRSVRAKTGTMSGISSLAGYLRTKKGTMIAFSIMVNGFVGYSTPVRAAQDSIIKLIYEKF